MSFDEQFVLEVLAALRRCHLEAILVGNAAALLHGAPVTTRDVDLLIRDTTRNRQKVKAFAAALGGSVTRPNDLVEVLTVLGGRVPVDLILGHVAGNLRFESLKRRAHRIPIGSEEALVADLRDIIASKEAADRDKDRAMLPILRETLLIMEARNRKE